MLEINNLSFSWKKINNLTLLTDMNRIADFYILPNLVRFP